MVQLNRIGSFQAGITVIRVVAGQVPGHKCHFPNAALKRPQEATESYGKPLDTNSTIRYIGTNRGEQNDRHD